MSGSRGIYSVYLTRAEEERIRQIAELNGSSINFVVRIAVRKLLDMATPSLEITPPK